MSVALHLQAQVPEEVLAPAVQHADVSYAPLFVFTNGAGKVVPFSDGQMVEVGRRCTMVAIPEQGYVFTNWSPVNVFIITEYVSVVPFGPPYPVISFVVSPVPQFISDRVLRFTMQPVEVIYDDAGVRTVTRCSGWQANFVMEQRRDHGRGNSHTRDLK